MEKRSLGKEIAAVLLIWAADLLLGPGLMMLLRQLDITVCLPSRASSYPGRFLLQSALLSLCPGALLLIFRGRLKKNFPDQMGLRVRGGAQWTWVAVLLAVLGAMTAVGIRRTGDPMLTALNLVYYLVFVAFAEEFAVRGVMVYLLRKAPWTVQYLLPSLLFALLHILTYNDFQPLSLAYLWYFIRYHLFGLMASGCCLQLMKDRTGTLWVPILLHTIVDYAVVLT